MTSLTLNSSKEAPSSRARDFLIGGGIMGELIRSKDWAATPLGPIEDWPQSLRTTVSLCLASNFPINLIWGPEHIQIYNDGYRPICAGKHPQSLGEDYTKTWATAWEILDQAFQRALAGQTSFLENQRMFLDRNGYLEETFFTFSLSPIRDESGAVGGLFHPVTETTPQMLSQRRTRALQDLASRPSRSKTVQQSCDLAAQALTNYQLDLPFALIYLVDDEGAEARLSGSANLPPGTPASPVAIDLRGSGDSAWPLAEVIRTGAASTVSGLAEKFGPLACGPYPESPATALVLPIMMSGIDHPAAFLIVAVSPRLPFTEEYRGFVDLAAATLTAAMLNARAYEQERKRAEKLAELDTAKTLFFSNVSHEFRTPLTLMLGPLEEILSHPGEEFTARRDSIELVHRNSLRLLRLVNTLLDFSRIEADRVQAVYQPTNLATLTEDLASIFRSAIEKAGLLLKVDCPDLPEEIYVDRGMWEKIVLNLLSNAFKFTFEGSVTVELKDAGHDVELSVSDTGTGIPSHELPNLFKRFHRVSGARGRTYEGSGIGLALLENLVKLHSGTVRVRSEVGLGTTFYIHVPKGFQHLPAEQVNHAPKAEAPGTAGRMFAEEALRWLPETVPNGSAAGYNQPPKSSNGRSPNERTWRVLLADDNADMRQYIQNILTPEFEVEAVADGAKALRAIEHNPPDLVLTDVMMPELDGFGLLKKLRNDPLSQGVPIIMLSARAGEEARVEGLEARADDYLVKPFNARELLARVRVNLELANLRKELARQEEQRRGAEEIERQWRLFDTALSHSPDSMYIYDLDQRFIYANQALLAHWQKSLDEILGKSLRELGYPSDLAAATEAQLNRVIQDRVAVRNKASWKDASGRERQYDYALVPVLSEAGDVEAVAGSSRDITEFIETNWELREANADLEQFAFLASHDLRAPLRVISNASQWLEEDLAEHLTDETREHLTLMRSRISRMDKLLEDLLAYSRIGRATDGRYTEIISGDLLMDDVRALLSTEDFTLRVSPGFRDIQVCRMPLQQILMNLVGNAVKHHDKKKGFIDVTVEDAGEAYCFAVKDDGPGIPLRFHDEIFKMFQTLKPKDQVEGSGMGLAVVRKALEVFGGRLQLESAEGQGSTFRFTWPKQQQRRGKAL
ncbi:MAG: ATP-binding protein [Bryobacteraceae bacterium]